MVPQLKKRYPCEVTQSEQVLDRLNIIPWFTRKHYADMKNLKPLWNQDQKNHNFILNMLSFYAKNPSKSLKINVVM